MIYIIFECLLVWAPRPLPLPDRPLDCWSVDKGFEQTDLFQVVIRNVPTNMDTFSFPPPGPDFMILTLFYNDAEPKGYVQMVHWCLLVYHISLGAEMQYNQGICGNYKERKNST